MANAKTDGNQPAPQQTPQSQSVPVRTEQPQQAQGGELMRRDPFDLLARDPFQLLMRDPFQLMRDLLVEPFRALGGRRDAAWNPGFEIRETDDAFVFRADMPGVRNEDLEISMIGNQLQITGKREQEQQQDEGRYHTYERAYGSFARVFALPDSADVDSIRAELSNGVLTLSVPKKPGSAPQRRKVQIGSGGGQKS
ncbi:MAG TPA: HSP20 family small heat-shock protein [Kofleriaceae bacterium]|jgi:HSP20 family protein|nr:HSP20 family small heat-shock protein [Kofleriaceae bacterium]